MVSGREAFAQGTLGGIFHILISLRGSSLVTTSAVQKPWTLKPKVPGSSPDSRPFADDCGWVITECVDLTDERAAMDDDDRMTGRPCTVLG